MHFYKFKRLLIGALVLGAAVSAFAAPKKLTVTEKMKIETRYVIDALEQVHYERISLDKIDSKEFLKKYINTFDPNHLVLTKRQVDGFYARFGNQIKSYLKQGNVYPAFEIFLEYHEALKKRAAWVFKRLEEPFNFNAKEEYRPDRKELDWPATDKEADIAWNQRIKYELLNEMLSDIDEEKKATKEKDSEKREKVAKTFEERLEEARKSVKRHYEQLLESMNELDGTDIHEIFLSTLTQLHDPHSRFFSADSLKEFSMWLDNSLVGIGAVLTVEDDHVTIRELLPGGPAEESGEIRVKDQIIAVGQGDKKPVNIVGMPLRKAVKLIRGKEGSKVRLLIRPAGGDPSERKIVALIRQEIKITSNLAKAKIYEVENASGRHKIGLISLPAFYGPANNDPNEPSTTRDVKELLIKLKKLGVEGIVLDLRRNGGGLLLEAITLTGLFIPIGPVLHVKDARGNVREFLDTDPDVTWEGPLVVMSSRYTASSSEIFIGALKIYNRAIIVGDSASHGKGTVQLLEEVSPPAIKRLFMRPMDMGATKLTTQKWYLPDGSSTQLKGVKSDIVIPSINEHLSISEASLDNPLPWDSIYTLPWTHKDEIDNLTDNVYPNTIQLLRSKSQERQKQLEEFNYLKDNIEFFRNRKDQKEFSLNYDKRLSTRLKDNTWYDQMKDRRKELASSNFEFEEVKLNLVEKQEAESEANETRFKHLRKQKEEKTEDEDAEDETVFDIYIRESLRVMVDYLELKAQNNKQLANHKNSK